MEFAQWGVWLGMVPGFVVEEELAELETGACGGERGEEEGKVE